MRGSFCSLVHAQKEIYAHIYWKSPCIRLISSPFPPIYRINVHASGRVSPLSFNTGSIAPFSAFGRQLIGAPCRSSSQPKARSHHLLGYPRRRRNPTALLIEAGKPPISGAVYCITLDASPASSPRSKAGVLGSSLSGQVRTSPLSPSGGPHPSDRSEQLSLGSQLTTQRALQGTAPPVQLAQSPPAS